MENKELKFKKVDGTIIENAEKYVKDWTKENPYGKVIIGVDSQCHSRRIKYSIIIAMHYVDKMQVGHGCHLLICDIWDKRIKASSPESEMSVKLWKEAELALQTAELINGADQFFKQRIEVHLDVNSEPRYDSHFMYAAGIGLLQSAGYHALGKPFAKIASNVADHFCR